MTMRDESNSEARIYWCLEDECSVSPRRGCICQSCYYARYNLLDPKILAILNRGTVLDTSPHTSVVPIIVQRAVYMYLRGESTVAEMDLAIIEALAKQCDQLTKQLTDYVMSSSNSLIVLNNDDVEGLKK